MLLEGRELYNFFQEALSQTGLKYEYLKAVVAITWISWFKNVGSLLPLPPLKVRSENLKIHLNMIQSFNIVVYYW